MKHIKLFCEHDFKSKLFSFQWLLFRVRTPAIKFFLIVVLMVNLHTRQATSFELQQSCSVKMMRKAAWRCENLALQIIRLAGKKNTAGVFSFVASLFQKNLSFFCCTSRRSWALGDWGALEEKEESKNWAEGRYLPRKEEEEGIFFFQNYTLNWIQ